MICIPSTALEQVQLNRACKIVIFCRVRCISKFIFFIYSLTLKTLKLLPRSCKQRGKQSEQLLIDNCPACRALNNIVLIAFCLEFTDTWRNVYCLSFSLISKTNLHITLAEIIIQNLTAVVTLHCISISAIKFAICGTDTSTSSRNISPRDITIKNWRIYQMKTRIKK